MSSRNWTFEENRSWSNDCNLDKQCPINIDTSIADTCKDLCNLQIEYNPSSCRVKLEKHQNMQVFCDRGSYIVYNNRPFNLKEITFHTPSLHTIDGVRCDLEICLVHSLDDNPYSDNGVIISCLFNEGNYFGKTETFINQFINEVKINSEQSVDVSPDWGAKMIIPDRKAFYLYEGSVPFPPCSKMTNIVMEEIGSIGPTNLEILTLNLGKNIRPIQPLNNRSIYYNPGDNIPSKIIPRKGRKSNNKYFRCKLDSKKLETDNKTKNNNDKNKKPIVIPKGLSDTTKQRIKNIFLIIVVICIFIYAVVLTKYLFKNNIAQRIIIAIVGTQNLGGGSALDIIERWRTSSICV
jgi:carbonic anhydrase